MMYVHIEKDLSSTKIQVSHNLDSSFLAVEVRDLFTDEPLEITEVETSDPDNVYITVKDVTGHQALIVYLIDASPAVVYAIECYEDGTLKIEDLDDNS